LNRFFPIIVIFPSYEPYREVIESTYAGFQPTPKMEEYFWNHSISEISTALLKQGLKLNFMHEFDYSPYQRFPNVFEASKGKWQFTHFKAQIPYLFSIQFHK
jgi:hypothetical protein